MKSHRILITAALVPCLCIGNIFGQKIPAPTGSAPHPFSTKLKQRPVAGDPAYQSFRREIDALGAKLASIGVPLQPKKQTPTDIYRPAEIMRLKQNNGAPVDVVFDERGSVPIFMKGRKLQSRQPDVARARTIVERRIIASSFLSENRRLLRMQDPETEFIETESSTDRLGMTHIRYQQMYKGCEVWGYDARVHLSPEGNVESYNGRTLPTPGSVDLQRETVGEAEAVRTAARHVGLSPERSTVRRVIDRDGENALRKCWMVNIRGGLEENQVAFVDMESGKVLRSYNSVQYDGPVTGTGVDLTNQSRALKLYLIGTTYYMIDASKTMFKPAESTMPNDGVGVIYTLDAKHGDSNLYFVTAANNSTWPDKASVSAAFNGSKVYDYYSAVHSRNAIDGTGATMNVVVNFNTNYNNAFWNGQYMVFGNGDGSAFSDLAGALDVTAHEMTHGVVERTANLVYENQSGALNESFADVFGVLFEFWADPANGNWFLGEAVTTPAIAGDALRRMDDPGAANIAFDGQQPAHMNDYQNLPNTSSGDHGGVHTNSGIPNKAFYVFATSSGVTKEEAGQIYYRALSNYLTRNALFIDCRLAVIKAAEDLHGGAGNAWATAAAAAFDAVGIVTGSGTPPPPTQDPVQGSNYLAVIGASSGYLYRTSPTGANPLLISAAPLWGRPSATDNGSHLFYVDGNTNLHIVTSSGTSDTQLSTSGGFNNISVSPDGRYLAVTSVYGEAVIYLFDLQNSSNNKVLPLFTPTYTEGVTTGNIWYSDRLDWMSNSQIVMYDAYNIFVNASGDTVGYWDINLLRVADTAIARLFPPQAHGVNIGNPVFASNSDNIIAFDYFQEGGYVYVLAVDLNSGADGVVTNNYSSLGSPSFSNDDKAVFYHYITQSVADVWTVSLATDGITGLGDDKGILGSAVFPVAFSVGTRSVGVEEQNSAPAAFGLSQNYPNPFNPETKLEFRISQSGFVRLAVYDLLGREVAQLVNEERPAGTYTVPFHAKGLTSGVYIVRLQSGGEENVRRIVLVR